MPTTIQADILWIEGQQVLCSISLLYLSLTVFLKAFVQFLPPKLLIPSAELPGGLVSCFFPQHIHQPRWPPHYSNP